MFIGPKPKYMGGVRRTSLQRSDILGGIEDGNEEVYWTGGQ